MSDRNNERFLKYSTVAFFIVPIIGAIIAVFMPSYNAQRHYVQTNPNHTHVCTSSTFFNIKQEPNIKSNL
jgi:hypothetical protein